MWHSLMLWHTLMWHTLVWHTLMWRTLMWHTLMWHTLMWHTLMWAYTHLPIAYNKGKAARTMEISTCQTSNIQKWVTFLFPGACSGSSLVYGIRGSLRLWRWLGLSQSLASSSLSTQGRWRKHTRWEKEKKERKEKAMRIYKRCKIHTMLEKTYPLRKREEREKEHWEYTNIRCTRRWRKHTRWEKEKKENDWIGLQWSAATCWADGDWIGLDWIGLDGMGWDGMGWDGMGWDGMGWDGMGWDGMDGSHLLGWWWEKEKIGLDWNGLKIGFDWRLDWITMTIGHLLGWWWEKEEKESEKQAVKVYTIMTCVN